MKVKMNELLQLIRVWSWERELNTNDPYKQVIKLGEEFGELCDAMIKGNKEKQIDSIGDLVVVLTILSQQLGVKIEDCVQLAYDEIKNREGKTINGVFVKESDLS